jgi:predicted nucleotidyltransferase
MNLKSLYKCKIGSHAYGLVTPESDVDIREVVMPDDLSYYFGLRDFQQTSDPNEEDHVAWDYRKFLKLTAGCNTQMLEMLFSSMDCVLGINIHFHRLIIDNRKKFITKKVFHVIKGYALSEHMKALGLSSRDLGARRKEDIIKNGYSGRNASHCIRLLHAGTHALNTGEFLVRLEDPQKSLCMDLKLGNLSIDGYKVLFDQYLDRLETAYEKSTIAEEFDYDWLNETMVELTKEVLAVNQVQ